jgi:hypothetical protein
MYFVWICSIQIAYLFFHVCCRSLVLILPVLRIPGVKGGLFFSVIQIGTVQFVSWIKINIQTCPNLREIVHNKFVCIEFVLVSLQIDIIQFV